jgi:hypothetical protein
MTNQQSATNIHFTKQTDAEKKSKLTQAKNNRLPIVAWEKGSKSRDTFEIIDFYSDRFEIIIKPVSSTNLNNKNILFNFEINGLSYFGASKLVHLKDSSYVIDCRGDLFKGERRKNFRMLTYPHHQIYIVFEVDERYKGSNIISIVTGFTQTALFKNFLKMVGDKGNSDPESELSLRVLDISRSGVSFNVSEIERNIFTVGRVINKIRLNFSDEEILIPSGRVVYHFDYFSHDKNSRAYKIGLEFINIDINLDNKIGKKINDLLRDSEDKESFEDFLK